jgi:DNA-directed RNA polymerase subunit M/transcription elongation factor TFIIS
MALPKVDVPIYETKLISNGKVVKFRPFLVKEQKLFLMSAESNDIKEITKTVKQVLNNCLITKLEIDDLPSFDIEHLFIQLRARSVGEVVNLKYTCNNVVKDDEGNEKSCGGLVKFDVNLLELNPKMPEKHSTKIELTDKLGIVMKYPSFNILNYEEVPEESKLEKTIELIVSCVDYIYDAESIYYAKDTSKEEMVEFIENLQQDDVEKLQNFFLTMPKMKKQLDFKCKKCGYEEMILAEGIENFFV